MVMTSALPEALQETSTCSEFFSLDLALQILIPSLVNMEVGTGASSQACSSVTSTSLSLANNAMTLE